MKTSHRAAVGRGSAYTAGYAAIAGALTCIVLATLALAAEPLLELLSRALPV